MTDTAVPTPTAASRPARRHLLVVVAVVSAALGLAGLLVGCSSDEPTAAVGPSSTTVALGPDDVAAGTTAPTTAGGVGDGWAPAVRGRTPLRGFSEVAATVTAGDGSTCEVCLLAATTSEQRSRGLMAVTDADLGGYDGMLFEYADDVDGAFWMRNTPMPLSIAFFDGDGDLVSTADMAPCTDAPDCEHYPADGPFRLALEVPQGRLDDVGVDGAASIRVDGFRCPLADDA